MTKKTFLYLTPTRYVPKWLRQGRVFIEKNLGKPCPDMAVGCVTDEAWIAWETLANTFEETPKLKAVRKKYGITRKDMEKGNARSREYAHKAIPMTSNGPMDKRTQRKIMKGVKKRQSPASKEPLCPSRWSV